MSPSEVPSTFSTPDPDMHVDQGRLASWQSMEHVVHYIPKAASKLSTVRLNLHFTLPVLVLHLAPRLDCIIWGSFMPSGEKLGPIKVRLRCTLFYHLTVLHSCVYCVNDTPPVPIVILNKTRALCIVGYRCYLLNLQLPIKRHEK